MSCISTYLAWNSSRHQVPYSQLAVGIGAEAVDLATGGQQQRMVEAAREAVI